MARLAKVTTAVREREQESQDEGKTTVSEKSTEELEQEGLKLRAQLARARSAVDGSLRLAKIEGTQPMATWTGVLLVMRGELPIVNHGAARLADSMHEVLGQPARLHVASQETAVFCASR